MTPLTALISIVSSNEVKTLIVNILKDIKCHGRISLFWNKSNVGNLGNEKPDGLAKKAAPRDNIDLSYHPNKRNIRKTFYDKYMITWQQRQY